MKKLYILVISILGLVFSFWLMWHTLSYNSQTHTILISGKYWSDFGGHLPQIRSFSYGYNWPPEYPTFPGEPSRYHMLFYFLVGQLEKIGLRLDWALNLPSALGFFFLCVMIWIVAYRFFRRHSVAFLSVLFFLFNSSFSWLDFLQKNQLADLPKLIHFPSFGPWNGSQISAFWNLNIYTNQRHLGLSFTVALVVIYLSFSSSRKLTLLIGPLLGFLFLSNQVAFSSAALFAGWAFIVNPRIRRHLLACSLGFVPFLLFSLRYTQPPKPPEYSPVFLYNGPHQFWPVLKYWFLNIGLHLILIPLGFFLAPHRAKILILPLLALFILPNLFRFSPDMINNHKFFNFFLILGSMFTAYSITRYKLLLVLAPLLILGGIVDFFPVLNDNYGHLPDVAANPDANYFLRHTAPDAIVLNSFWFYHPASIAGRKIFNGYSYFTWSFGYDQVTRERKAVNIYAAPDKSTACRLLKDGNISYVELNDHPEGFILPNWDLWKTQFTPIYRNPTSGASIYNVSTSCPNSSS